MSADYTLSYGTHATPADGRCAMEWVSYLAGEPHSDDPACVSPVLRAFCTTLNDSLEDGPRQRLRPYLARTIGTVDDGLDEVRSWMAMDWLIRTYAPAWLELAGLAESAQRVAGLAPVLDSASLHAARVALGPARTRRARPGRRRSAPPARRRGLRGPPVEPPPARRRGRPPAPPHGPQLGSASAISQGITRARRRVRSPGTPPPRSRGELVPERAEPQPGTPLARRWRRPSRRCVARRSCCSIECCRPRRSWRRSPRMPASSAHLCC